MKLPSWLVTFLLAGGIIALMLGFAAEAIGGVLRDLPAALAYNAAPTCPAREITTPDGAPCRAWLAAVVAARWTEYQAARYGGTHYYLDLRVGGGTTYPVELPDTGLPWGGLWDQLRSGTAVEVELWQDQVAHVRAGTRSEPTTDDPASQGTSSLLSCLCLAPYSLLVVIIATALVLQRNEQARRPRAQGETARGGR